MTNVDRRPWLRLFHRTSALLLASFVLVHITNHVVGLAGQAEHIAFMHAVRPIYRNAVVEPILLALFLAQGATGATLVIRGWRSRRGGVAWAQAFSGLYLAAFLLIHIVSVVMARSALQLDTDFRFAAAGFHVAGWPWYFAPYYFLAALALFVHVGCALYWKLGARARLYAWLALGSMTMLGIGFGFGVVASLAGRLYPVEIQEEYLGTYKS